MWIARIFRRQGSPQRRWAFALDGVKDLRIGWSRAAAMTTS
jgi:hypothetical protein